MESNYTSPEIWGFDYFGHTSFFSNKIPEDYALRIEWSAGVSEEQRAEISERIAASLGEETGKPIQSTEAEPISREFIGSLILDTRRQIVDLANLLNLGGHSDKKREQIEMTIGLFSQYEQKLTDIRNQLPE